MVARLSAYSKPEQHIVLDFQNNPYPLLMSYAHKQELNLVIIIAFFHTSVFFPDSLEMLIIKKPPRPGIGGVFGGETIL